MVKGGLQLHERKTEQNKTNQTAVAAEVHILLFIELLTVIYTREDVSCREQKNMQFCLKSQLLKLRLGISYETS